VNFPLSVPEARATRAAAELLRLGVDPHLVEDCGDCLGCFPVGPGDRVAVHIEGHACAGMTDTLGNVTDRETGAESLGDMPMPEVVEARLDLQAAGDAPEALREHARVQRLGPGGTYASSSSATPIASASSA